MNFFQCGSSHLAGLARHSGKSVVPLRLECASGKSPFGGVHSPTTSPYPSVIMRIGTPLPLHVNAQNGGGGPRGEMGFRLRFPLVETAQPPY